MALSLSNFVVCCALFWASVISAETRTYDFNITWVTANPDGLQARPVIGINGKWPIPVLNITVGDRLIVNVNNQLGNQSASLHFHGLFQNGTTEMDGPVGANQCGIPPGSTFTYNFTVDQSGTYWYHSHVSGQYPDGLRGPLIVEDPNSPHKGKWDGEFIMTLSDWYHEQMPALIKTFISYTNPTGAEPVPQSAVMNDMQNATFPVEAGKTYLFHIVNMAAFASQYLWFEGHTMRIVEVDGVWTEEAEADMLYISTAQRYSVLVTMKNYTTSNFAIVGSMDEDLFDTVPSGLNANATGYLVYDDTKPLPLPTGVSEFNPFDDYTLVPSDGLKIFENVDHQITLEFEMDDLGNGANYAFFNGVSYVRQKVPTLYTVLSAPADLVSNASIYGVNSNSFVLEHGEVVEIVVNSGDSGKHPFHLHAHNFQVVARSADNAGYYDPNNKTMLYDDAPAPAYPPVPMRRDTILVHPYGNVVLRFRADNPGVWLFHCHIEWHMDTGLVATMVEAPLALRAQKGDLGVASLPASHIDSCKAGGSLYEGNAGGNMQNFLDLSDANLSVPPLPAGFTAKGIVALVFSVVAAFLGLASISWYGFGEITNGSGAKRRAS